MPVTLTKCNHAPCESLTANTFCSRECNRLAHLGPGTRSQPRRTETHGAVPMNEGADSTTHVSRAEWLHVRAYFQQRERELPPSQFFAHAVLGNKDNSGMRRVLNAKKRREEAEARRQKRRDARRKRR